MDGLGHLTLNTLNAVPSTLLQCVHKCHQVGCSAHSTCCGDENDGDGGGGDHGGDGVHGGDGGWIYAGHQQLCQFLAHHWYVLLTKLPCAAQPSLHIPFDYLDYF